MPTLVTQLDPHSESFQANTRAMLAQVESFRDIEAKIRNNSQRQQIKFHERGQLLPRERLAALLDRGAPFLELSSLAGLHMHDDDGADNAMGGGIITGIGWVSGTRCVITVNDSAIKGGTVTPMGLQKTLRALEVAATNKLPCVHLVESGGANLMYQSEIFVEGGRVFRALGRLSAQGLPQITVVHGTSIAGGAYMPGMSDYVIAVAKRAQISLAGAPLVKAATGEDATDEDLGGADMHATVSGTVEYTAANDVEAVAIARDVVAKLAWNDHIVPRSLERTAPLPPRYPTDDIVGVVPADSKKPYDVREIIARLVDDSEFLAFKERYGEATVCGHAAVGGYSCGIVGNNGPIDPQGSAKVAQFIQLCCQAHRPIIYLQNTTGYMVGTAAEQAGIVKHGAKMIQAVANAQVPQITLVVGGAYGAGNYGMCGRAFDPRFIFSWPNSRIAVMGGEQAARVMGIITRQKLARQGQSVDEDALGHMQKAIVAKIDQESTALFATARLWDDGIIDPRDSRNVLRLVLATCAEAEHRTLRSNSFGVARL